jgi:hypothetical protein
MRFDLYGLIHKAQRFHLFLLSNDLGRTDAGDAACRAKCESRLRRLVEHLKDHAANEEKYIHPLFHRLGEAAEGLDEAHARLESELADLERMTNDGGWAELYPAYARFLGSYLLHLDEEEKAQSETLWRHYSDEQLASVFHRFKTERAPEAAKADLVFMVPALSVAELARMFGGMKASMPVPAYKAVCDLAAGELDAARWAEVISRIS